MRKLIFGQHFSMFDLMLFMFGAELFSDILKQQGFLLAVLAWMAVMVVGVAISVIGESWEEIKKMWNDGFNEKEVK